VGLALMGLLVSAGPAAAQLLSAQPVTMATAKQVAATAEAAAVTTNAKVVVAIVDAGGNLVYLHRMPDVPIARIRSAIRKATAAVRLQRSTKTVEDLVTGGRTAFLGVANLAALEGGIPVIVDGKVLGAVGVSGLTPQQDAQIAQAAADNLLNLLAR
jgi:glc operon protein GlcG